MIERSGEVKIPRLEEDPFVTRFWNKVLNLPFILHSYQLQQQQLVVRFNNGV